MSILLSFTVPESGLIEPLIVLNKLVLPAPLGPIRQLLQIFQFLEKRY